MAPSAALTLSPAELSYLQTSLLQAPPIRPDGRSSNQFRPLIAEADLLPAAYGSARICFADGTEAIVGVKAEVEKSVGTFTVSGETEQEGVRGLGTGAGGDDDADMEDADAEESRPQLQGSDAWVNVSVEIPGLRDDDQMPVFLASMLSESLLADGQIREKLYINSRFHWMLYVDILLLSAALSYPLPLLSLTTHLALLQTKVPALISEREEDPLFNDDWEAAVPLYTSGRPPITLLVMTIGNNILFDPGQDELAVADGVLAVSVAEGAKHGGSDQNISVISMRAIDPPSRTTNPGIPNSMNSATGGQVSSSKEEALAMREAIDPQQVWRPPRGGMKRALIAPILKAVTAEDGVAREILDALDAVVR